MKHFKIAIISDSLIYGGGEVFVKTLVECVKPQYTYLLCKNPKLRSSLTIDVSSKKLTQSVLIMLVLQIHLKRDNVIFMLNGVSESRKYFWIAYLVPTVLISHSQEAWGPGYDTTFRQRLRTIINKILFNRIKYVVAVCATAAQNLSQNFAEKKISVIYNTDINAHQSTDMMAHNKSIKRVGYIGRLSDEKGVALLIKAYREMVYSSIPIITHKLIIAGVGERRELVEQFVLEMNQLNIDLQVEYLGFVDKETFYNQVDVVVIPSKTEANPLVLIESFARRKLVIASDIEPIQEIIRHEHNGLLFPKQNATALHNLLVTILSKRLETDLIDEAEQYYLKNLSPDVFRSKYHALFNEVGKK